MAIAAMAIAAVSLTVMSFGKNDTSTSNWYEVDANGIINPEPMLNPPSNSPTAECSTVKDVNACALQIELDSNLPFPETETEARADHNVINDAFSDYL